MRSHVELYRQGEQPKWMQHAFLEVRLNIFKKLKGGLEFFDAITYPYQCLSISSQDRPNMN